MDEIDDFGRFFVVIFLRLDSTEKHGNFDSIVDRFWVWWMGWRFNNVWLLFFLWKNCVWGEILGRPGVVPQECDNIFSTFVNERLAKRGRHKSQLLVSRYKIHGQREALILYLIFNTHVHLGRLDHFRKLNQ